MKVLYFHLIPQSECIVNIELGMKIDLRTL